MKTTLSPSPKPKTEAALLSSRLKPAAGHHVPASALHGLPPTVQNVLASPGTPLDETARAELEPHFGHDFSGVRVHTDAKAADSARTVGALAYTVGSRVAFAGGQYAPASPAGKKLIAHELVHVVQQSGSSSSSGGKTSGDQAAEREAESLAAHVGAGKNARVQAAVPAGLQRQAAPTDAISPLNLALQRIHNIHSSRSMEDSLGQVMAAVEGIDLQSRANLNAVVRAISATFGSDARLILSAFLTRIDQAAQRNQQARMEQNLQNLQIGRRGPYGQFGPGVVFPVVANAARPLLPVYEALLPAMQAMDNAFAGGGTFLSGVMEGLSGSLNEAQRLALANRLLGSSALNVVFPEVFAAGTVVGVGEDVVEMVKSVYHLVTNLGEFVEGVRGMANLVISREFASIGRVMGVAVGQSFGARLAQMAQENIVAFTYDLGRMIGPTIVYTILAIVGAPEVAMSALVTRLVPLLRPLLERFPALLRLAERMAVVMRERSAATRLGRQLERRRLAAAAAASARQAEAAIAPLLARIATETRSAAIVTRTFEEAVAAGLATESVSIAQVIAALPSDAAGTEFRELYRIAYNGINNRATWEAVMSDVAREAQRTGTGAFSHPEVTSRTTQAIWNLSERAAGPGNPIFVVPADSAAFTFFEGEAPFGRRFYDVNIGREHGMSAHMMQDLVVDRAFQQAGRSMTAEQFRRRMGSLTLTGPRQSQLRRLLWNALYDSNESLHGLTAPENVIALLRSVFGKVD